MLRLEDYLDRSKLKHHSALARQEFVLHQQMAEQEKEKENSFAPTDTAASENVVEKNLGNLHQEGVTLLQDRGSPSKEEEDLPTLPRSLSVVTTEPQPPPLEKYANLSTLASDGIGNCCRFLFSYAELIMNLFRKTSSFHWFSQTSIFEKRQWNDLQRRGRQQREGNNFFQ